MNTDLMAAKWTWDRHHEMVWAADPNADEVVRFAKAWTGGVSLQRVIVRVCPIAHDGLYTGVVNYTWCAPWFECTLQLEESFGGQAVYAYEASSGTVEQRIQDGSDPGSYQNAHAVYRPFIWDLQPRYRNPSTDNQVLSLTLISHIQDLDISLQTHRMDWHASVQFDALFSQPIAVS